MLETYTLRPVKEEEIYYHALSHHVAHWAAFGAMMVALGTAPLVITSSATPFLGLRCFGAFISIGAVLVGALYFIKGMDTYGRTLRDGLPPAYLSRIQHLSHEATIGIGRIAAVLAAFADWILIWFV